MLVSHVLALSQFDLARSIDAMVPVLTVIATRSLGQERYSANWGTINW